MRGALGAGHCGRGVSPTPGKQDARLRPHLLVCGQRHRRRPCTSGRGLCSAAAGVVVHVCGHTSVFSNGVGRPAFLPSAQ